MRVRLLLLGRQRGVKLLRDRCLHLLFSRDQLFRRIGRNDLCCLCLGLRVRLLLLGRQRGVKLLLDRCLGLRHRCVLSGLHPLQDLLDLRDALLLGLGDPADHALCNKPVHELVHGISTDLGAIHGKRSTRDGKRKDYHQFGGLWFEILHKTSGRAPEVLGLLYHPTQTAGASTHRPRSTGSYRSLFSRIIAHASSSSESCE